MSDAGNLWEEDFEQYRVENLDEVASTRPEPAKRLKVIDRNQTFWGEIDIQKFISQDHPVRGIWTMVERLDLTALEAKIKAVEGKAGQSSFDPRLLMALWIYGYSEGISSARELSRMCEYEPGCRWLTAMQLVNYHTLSDFRIRHKQELDDIFVQVLGLLSAEGFVEMKRITLDGTKVRAHAGADSFRREERIRQHLELARQQVEEMSDLESEDHSQRQIQARQRAAREKKQRLEDALKELEQLQKTRAEAEKANTRVSETDPEARVMKQSDGGFAPSYNVQVSTDTANGIIVAVDVTPAGNDCDQLQKAIDQTKANTGKTPEQVLADGGYSMKLSNIETMAERGIDFIAPVVETDNEASLKNRGIEPEFYPDQFQYDESTDTMTCPAGQPLTRIRKQQREGRVEYSYQASAADCRACPFRDRCCPKTFARTVIRRQNSPAVMAFRAKMQTEEAKQVFRLRAPIAEFSNAWLKEKLAFRRFRLRGRLKARAEAVWRCLTYNIQQWLRLRWRITVSAAA